jgi:histidyl-tRNA synthetase
MFEDLGVFLRLGEATDVVTKEMYDFEDKGGRRVALRPEQTASVCRAYAQHRPVPPWKVWYAGPNFRYEKPQQGRYRQFDQVGVELLGPCDPDADAEVIALAWGFYRRLGLRQITLSVNTLGDEGDLQRYTTVLQAYLESRVDELSEESRVTLTRNPLRVLDSKRPADAAVVAGAPRIVDHVGDAARSHFEGVLSVLRSLGVPYAVEDRLVRGLDYYRHTTFEFSSSAEGDTTVSLKHSAARRRRAWGSRSVSTGPSLRAMRRPASQHRTRRWRCSLSTRRAVARRRSLPTSCASRGAPSIAPTNSAA